MGDHALSQPENDDAACDSSHLCPARVLKPGSAAVVWSPLLSGPSPRTHRGWGRPVPHGAKRRRCRLGAFGWLPLVSADSFSHVCCGRAVCRPCLHQPASCARQLGARGSPTWAQRSGACRLGVGGSRCRGMPPDGAGYRRARLGARPRRRQCREPTCDRGLGIGAGAGRARPLADKDSRDQRRRRGWCVRFRRAAVRDA